MNLRMLVCDKEEGPDGCYLHLAADQDEQRFRVQVPLEVARGVTVGTEIDAPADLSNPEVTMAFQWRW